MKIMHKDFLFSISIIVTVTAVSLTILYFIMPVYYEKTKIQEMTTNFNTIATQLDGKSLDKIKEEVSQPLFEGKTDFILFISDESGKLIYPAIGQGYSFDIPINEEQPTNNKALSLPVEDDSNANVIKQTFFDSTGKKYNLLGLYSLQPISDASNVLLEIYPYLLLIDIIIGGSAAFFYSRFSTKRIKEISTATNQMLSLDHHIKCPVRGNDELSMLAQDINQLDDSLLKSIDALKVEIAKVEEIENSKAEMMRITSHELKTPVASLMGIIDGMIYNVGKFQDREFYLKKCKDILEKQAKMIQDILIVSKLDMFSPDESKSLTFSMKELLQERLEMYLLVADVEKRHFDVHLEDIMVKANKEEITRVIDNLLSNAYRYTVSEGQISIVLKENRLEIKNEASRLLSDSELKSIFDPFYRPDYGRNRDTGGSGLGLFIVKQILDRESFGFEFEQVVSKFMCFTIFLKEKDPNLEE